MLSTQGNRCGAKSVASKNTGHSAALGQLHQHQIFAPRTLYTGARGGQSYARQRRHSGKGKLTYSHYRKFLLLLGSTQAPLRSTCHDIVCIFCPNHTGTDHYDQRSEEHTSELQSRGHLVCRLMLEKKNL